MTLGERVQD